MAHSFNSWEDSGYSVKSSIISVGLVGRFQQDKVSWDVIVDKYHQTGSCLPSTFLITLGQCCQVAISVARFDQTWLYCDPPGYFILFLATGKILAISWLFGKEALKLIFSLIESLYLP